MPKRWRQKLKYLEKEKRFWNKNKKHFLIIFEGLSLKQIKKSCFGRWESDFKYEKHIDFPFYRAFPTSIYLSKFNNKTERHCAKYVQSKTKNKFWKIKCVKLSFYKCVHFLLLWLLSTLWIYHFYGRPILFLLLYLSFHLDSLHRHPDFPHFSHFYQDFRPRF